MFDLILNNFTVQSLAQKHFLRKNIINSNQKHNKMLYKCNKRQALNIWIWRYCYQIGIIWVLVCNQGEGVNILFDNRIHQAFLSQWYFNGMLHHSLGGAVIFISLQHFIAFVLDLMPCLPSQRRREAINFFKNSSHYCIRGPN